MDVMKAVISDADFAASMIYTPRCGMTMDDDEIDEVLDLNWWQ